MIQFILKKIVVITLVTQLSSCVSKKGEITFKDSDGFFKKFSISLIDGEDMYHGPCLIEKGEYKVIGHYSNGKKSGRWITYISNKIINISNYEEGEIVNSYSGTLIKDQGIQDIYRLNPVK